MHAKLENQILLGQRRVQVAMLDFPVRVLVGRVHYVKVGKSHPVQEHFVPLVRVVRFPMQHELHVSLVRWEKFIPQVLLHVRRVLMPERPLMLQTLLVFHVQ